IDYREVAARYMHEPAMRGFFGGPYDELHFENVQRFDLEGLTGRLLSSSYAPPAAHPRHAPMLEALRGLFEAHAVDGRVAFEYDAVLVFGRVR
ncbi:MAG TPA: SAM-dependent methyltransferase, partial [Vicinamibacteria bacterium]|nr:SAM-dependent methyltransferase [Vicinamibacteria bacterium]